MAVADAGRALLVLRNCSAQVIHSNRLIYYGSGRLGSRYCLNARQSCHYFPGLSGAQRQVRLTATLFMFDAASLMHPDAQELQRQAPSSEATTDDQPSTSDFGPASVSNRQSRPLCSPSPVHADASVSVEMHCGPTTGPEVEHAPQDMGHQGTLVKDASVLVTLL